MQEQANDSFTANAETHSFDGSAWFPKHPLVKDWPLVSNHYYNCLLVSVYVIFVKYVGPWLMRNRKPYELKSIIQIYNVVQVYANAYILYHLVNFLSLDGFDFRCQPIDFSTKALRIGRISWIYYMLKYTEFLDTIFFVLRKKNEQISNLHVLHHAGMPIFIGFCIGLSPNGHSCVVLGLCNTFVHVVMYAYYFLAALGPSVRKYLWWKKYLTIMQLIQFAIIFFHSLQIFYNGCDYPKVIAGICVGSSSVMFLMFSQFYVHSYLRDRRQAVKGKFK